MIIYVYQKIGGIALQYMHNSYHVYAEGSRMDEAVISLNQHTAISKTA